MHANWRDAIATLVVVFACLAGQGHAEATPPGYGLITEDQKAVEALSLRLLSSPAVLAMRKKIEKTYRDDPIYETPGAAGTIKDAVTELVYQAATYVATEDPLRPRALWTFNAPRKSDGVDIPGTRFIESTDSIYRVVTVDAVHHYEISGRIPLEGPPAFLTFEVWNAAQGLQPDVRYMGHFTGDDLVLDPDGSFVLLVGPEPADSRKNYLQTAHGGWIIIRQSLSDWMTQSPVQGLAVRMLETADGPAPTFAELEKRLVEVLPMAASVNRTYMHRMFEERSDEGLYIGFGNSLNHLNPTVATRGGAWGYVTGTKYLLGDDEALVITMEPDDARYFSIQLQDAWGRTLDPRFTTNRNNSGSIPNPDETITYVITRKDPGVANWLDTRGYGSGSVIMRWQGVAASENGKPAELIRDSRLVPFDELMNTLPDGVPMMSADARNLELQRRKLAYERRLR